MSNFIRTIKNEDDTETLVVLGTNNHMQVVGTLYFFKPLDDYPFKKRSFKNRNSKKKLRLKL